MALKIGDTIYRFDVNRRVYSKPKGAGRLFGDLIWAEHFQPLKIVSETKVSWVLEYGYKANKKALAGDGDGDFFTEQQKHERVWDHEHRYEIVELVKSATAKQLRDIAAIVGYTKAAA